jgi:hypothetical protein
VGAFNLGGGISPQSFRWGETIGIEYRCQCRFAIRSTVKQGKSIGRLQGMTAAVQCFYPCGDFRDVMPPPLGAFSHSAEEAHDGNVGKHQNN